MWSFGVIQLVVARARVLPEIAGTLFLPLGLVDVGEALAITVPQRKAAVLAGRLSGSACAEIAVLSPLHGASPLVTSMRTEPQLAESASPAATRAGFT
jgi:hypothetical protein